VAPIMANLVRQEEALGAEFTKGSELERALALLHIKRQLRNSTIDRHGADIANE
jgi:hypothetical protein